ncbi:TolC family protein [Blastopirellula retiformator]|uniref:Cobalt-zinc-cadmium resistance protein CzcC n=1 Tax=Blastopirellula retiformator TaxID=2527970 RepID=A0A5C5V992_9BACT|nr:TolC family protein [Blastopirellula retiformator]TWT34851.1 Cobalt-zinc-cadmium resistance protein CzcC precursor [Blastopirellula retiformator]
MKKASIAFTIGLAAITSGCRTTSPASTAHVPVASAAPTAAALASAEQSLTQASELPAAKAAPQDLPAASLVSYQQEPATAEPISPPVTAIRSTGDWSLTELEELALQNNPALAEAVARVNAAHGNWVQVGLAPNPVLGYSGQQLGSGGLATQTGMFIGQEFVTGHKLGLNREIAAWEIQRAERDLDAFRLRVLTDVRIGYYDVLIAQRRRELAAELVQIAEKGEQSAAALFKGQEVSQADPLRASVEAQTARIVLQNSINQHVEAWRRLTAVLGMPAMQLQPLQGEINADDMNLQWDETLTNLMQKSPELAAALANVEAAHWAVQRAYAEVIPNIEVQAIIQDDRGIDGTDGNLQVTLPLPLWNRNQGGIQRAYADAAAANRAADKLSMDLQARLAVAFQRYESARNQVTQYARPGGILENAQRSLELIRIGYEADEFAVIDLLNAQRTYFQTNLAYLDSQRELWISATEIRGLMLQGSLEK